MPPKSIPSPEQGSFFHEEIIRSGTTEPSQLRPPEVRLEVAPEGTFAEPAVETPRVDPDPELTARVQREVAVKKHHDAQVSSHSPLQRNGSYLDVLPGDVLPGFGIVRKSNFTAAKAHARELEDERLENSH